MTQCGIAIALAVGPVACARLGCASGPAVPVAPPPAPSSAAPMRPVEEYEILIRDQGGPLVLVLRSTSGTKVGEWTVGPRPTPAELAPVARAVPPSASGARRVTVRAGDRVVYSVLVALLDACHENGVSDVAVGPPP